MTLPTREQFDEFVLHRASLPHARPRTQSRYPPVGLAEERAREFHANEVASAMCMLVLNQGFGN